MSTYFVLYTKHGVNGDADRTILVYSESTGEALYDDVVKAIRRFWAILARCASSCPPTRGGDL